MFSAFIGKSKSCLAFFAGGIVDRIKYRSTGKKSTFGKCVAAKLSECEPWTDHYDVSAMEDIRDAITNHDFVSARGLADITVKEGAEGVCVGMLKSLIEWLAEGKELTCEVIPFLE